MQYHKFQMHRLNDATRDDPAQQWVIMENLHGLNTVIGHITERHTFVSVDGEVKGPLASVALSIFMSHAAYYGVNAGRGEHHEVIVSEIEEVPGLYGLLGSGWPPREDV